MHNMYMKKNNRLCSYGNTSRCTYNVAEHFYQASKSAWCRVSDSLSYKLSAGSGSQGSRGVTCSSANAEMGVSLFKFMGKDLFTRNK